MELQTRAHRQSLTRCGTLRLQEMIMGSKESCQSALRRNIFLGFSVDNKWLISCEQEKETESNGDPWDEASCSYSVNFWLFTPRWCHLPFTISLFRNNALTDSLALGIIQEDANWCLVYGSETGIEPGSQAKCWIDLIELSRNSKPTSICCCEFFTAGTLDPSDQRSIFNLKNKRGFVLKSETCLTVLNLTQVERGTKPSEGMHSFIGSSITIWLAGHVSVSSLDYEEAIFKFLEKYCRSDLNMNFPMAVTFSGLVDYMLEVLEIDENSSEIEAGIIVKYETEEYASNGSKRKVLESLVNLNWNWKIHRCAFNVLETVCPIGNVADEWTWNLGIALKDCNVRSSVSLGISSFPPDATLEELVSADKSLVLKL